MPQDSHIPFYHTTIRRKLQEVFKIFLRKLCGVKFPSQCNSKCCCCGCLDNLRICLLADVRPAPAVPCGAACLPCRPPALPLACFVAHIPPAPFPGGEGGDFWLSYARGFAPCIPEGWAGRGTGFACGKPVSSALNRALAPAGASGIRVKKSPPLRGGNLYGRDCKCRRRLNAGDARGGAPCMKITLVTPFPAGEERSTSAGWGIGGREAS